MFTRIVFPILLLACGVGAWVWLGRPVEKPKPVIAKELPIKAEVLDLKPSDYQIWIESQGIVRAHYETTVTPLVAGMVVAIHPCFEDGAFFEKDQIFAELDPADFLASLASSEARLARAEALLSQEQARAKQARLNWEDIGYEEEPSALVLRVPQLKEAEAAVKSANAEVDQARRNLERTKIRAPFAGRVKSRNIGLGQSVGPNTALGLVFATEFAEVRLPISPAHLSHVVLPSREGDPSVAVQLSDALDLQSSTTWKAQIIRTEGTLDSTTRELFAIARIDDPFRLKQQNSSPDQTLASLRIGQPVRARICGNVLNDVFVLPRNTLRGINRVLMIEGSPPKLKRREIEPVWSNADDFVVREGLRAGELLCLTSLTYAPDGALIEIVTKASASENTASVEPLPTPENTTQKKQTEKPIIDSSKKS